MPLRLLLENEEARERYPRCMTVAYHVSRSMLPLMEVALERARLLAPDDPVAAGLVAYLERHIPEEIHSDEPGGALLEDLVEMGLDPVELREGPVAPQIATLVTEQLAWIENRHPVTILGFLELEAHQADRGTLERLIETTGLPRAAFRQQLLHARLDAMHAIVLHRVLDSLPLEPHHEQLIGISALRTISLVTDALLEALAPSSSLVAGRPGGSGPGEV